MSEVKERPILFSAPMVRAILDGRKTQTRRVVNPQPINSYTNPPRFDDTKVGDIFLCPDYLEPKTKVFVVCTGSSAYHNVGWQPFCEMYGPYGKPPDRLWVRETWTGTWIGDSMHVVYAATGEEQWFERGDIPDGYVLPKAAARAGNYVTPLFMPRWASRIMLEVTEVRVQQLTDVSQADAKAEGIAELPLQSGEPGAWWSAEAAAGPALHGRDPKAAFRKLWDSINAKRGFGWESNPWVWAITFRRVDIAERRGAA